MDGWIDWLGCLADWQVDIEIDNIDVYQDAVSRSPVCTNQPVTLYPKDKKASRGVQGLVNVGTKTRFLDVSGFSFALAILENVVLLCLPRIYADAFPSRHGASDLKMGVSENSVPLLGIMAIIGNIPYFQTNPDDPFFVSAVCDLPWAALPGSQVTYLGWAWKQGPRSPSTRPSAVPQQRSMAWRRDRATFLGGSMLHPNGYGSISINTIFNGMNIHLPAILMWTEGVQGLDTLPNHSLETLKISDVYEYVDRALLKMIKAVVALLHHHEAIPNSYGYVNHLECARIMRYYFPMVRCKFSASHFFLQLVWRGCWQVSADSRCQTRHVRRRTLKHGCI